MAKKKLEIEIRGNTKQFQKELEQLGNGLRNANGRAQSLKKSLQVEWDNKKFLDAQKQAQKAVEKSTEKVKLLKEGLESLEQAPASEARNQEIEKLTTKLINAETEAKKAVIALKSINDLQFKQADSQLRSLKESLKLNWDNKKFLEAHRQAKSAVEETTQKVKGLEEKLSALQKVEGNPEITQQMETLNDQLAEAQIEAKAAKYALDDLNDLRRRQANQQLGAAGGKAIQTGAVMSAAITAPLALLANEGKQVYSDLAESQNVVEQAFGASASKVDEWSKTLLQSNGISELTAKQTAGLYKAMGDGMDVPIQKGEEMAMNLTALAGDVSSFYNTSYEMSSKALEGIYTGETEALKKYGVVMTEANLQAYALAQGYETLYKDMDQGEKVMLRYQFVTDALKVAQGDFARTIDSTANQERLAAEQRKQAAAELVKGIMPAYDELLKVVNKLLTGFNQLSDGEKKALTTILATAAATGPVITVMGAAAKGVSGFRSALEAAKLASDGASKAVTLLNLAANPLTATLGAAAVALVALAVQMDAAYNPATRLNNAIKESRQEYEAAVQAAEKAQEASRQEVETTQQLIQAYDELNSKTELTAQEKERLQGVVEQLNQALPGAISLLDEETGRYSTQASVLYGLNEERAREIRLLQMREEVLAGKKRLEDIETEKSELQQQIDDKTRNLETAKITGDDYSVGDLQAQIDGLTDSMRSLEQEENKLNRTQKIFERKMEGGFHPEKSIASTGIKAIYGEDINGFNRERDLLIMQRDMDLITNEQYLARLKEIQEKYLAENSAEWREAQAEITQGEAIAYDTRLSNLKGFASAAKSIQKSQYEEQIQYAKDAYNYEKQLVQDRYNAEVKAVEKALAATEKKINAEIAAIDKEIEARKRLKEDEATQEEKDAIIAQLQYGKLDDFTRRELLAQLDQIHQQEADRQWEREQADRKEALQQELADAREVAEQKKADLQSLLETEQRALDEAYNLHIEQLNQVFGMSSTEMNKISTDFVKTLDEGAKQVVRQLEAMIEKLRRAQNSARQAANVTYDYSDRSSRLTLTGTSYTDEQAARVFRNMMLR